MKMPDQFRPTFWRVILGVILCCGLYGSLVRIFGGLGASTALSDQFPWGLWIGFDVLCGVALAAGGFTISAVVYIFHIERFRPVIRPAILTAFLGYLLAITALFFDLGRPERLWHPLVLWNTHSVMFEVAWCVMLYTTVLALEFSPILFERLGWKKPLNLVHKLIIPLVIAGTLLSMLHQSSLGSLFLIVPGKLHPLWYSPFLPVFFFISAIALGCAMTIFESFLSYRAFRKRLEIDLLSDLGKVIVVTLVAYLALKFLDLTDRGVLGQAFAPTYEGRLFLAEILLGVVAPAILLAIPRFRNDHFGLFAGSLLVVLGFMMNRLNVSITGLEGSAGIPYFPSWTEISVTALFAAAGFVLFGLAVKHFPVFPEAEKMPAHEAMSGLPAVAALRRPLSGTTAPVLSVLAVLGLLGLGLGWNAAGHRSAPEMASAHSGPAEGIADALKEFKSPSDILYRIESDDQGPVTFRHATHFGKDQPTCLPCHGETFMFLKKASGSSGGSGGGSGAASDGASTGESEDVDFHEEKYCGSCHDGKTSFAVQKNCGRCHEPKTT